MIVKYLLKIAMLGSSWVMYLLLMLSVASIGAMVERWLFFRKRGGGDELGDDLCRYLEEGQRDKAHDLLHASPTIEAEVLRASLRWAHGGPDALAAAIDGEMIKRRRELERGMTLLGTLGNNAPFVGLLGTVIGVIVAFADLADGQNKIQMDRVMGGIAEALVATGVGLFVAIPAVVAFNVFQKKIGDIEDNVASVSKRLCAFISVGKPQDWARASQAPPPVRLAADSVRDLASLEAGDASAPTVVGPPKTAVATREPQEVHPTPATRGPLEVHPTPAIRETLEVRHTAEARESFDEAHDAHEASDAHEANAAHPANAAHAANAAEEAAVLDASADNVKPALAAED